MTTTTAPTTQTTHQVTVTVDATIEVTDPAAITDWAARDMLNRAAFGAISPARQAAADRLRNDVTAAVEYAYRTDPDIDPPGLHLRGTTIKARRVV